MCIRDRGYPFQTHAEYTESGETARGTQDREDGSRRLPARTVPFSTLGLLFIGMSRECGGQERALRCAAHSSFRKEKRERERKRKEACLKESEEKTRKRSSSSIEKRVRLRRDVYIERTRNKI